MLFNSYTFLFLFLPAVLAGTFALARYRASYAVAWLVFASLFFYGWWSPRHVLLLVASIAFNYAAGEAIAKRGGKGSDDAFVIMWGAIAVNLAVLGYFKYAGFLVANVDALFGASMRMEAIVLPARHLVLHFHADRLSGRRLPRIPCDYGVVHVRAVRQLLSAPHRRPHSASPRDDAAVRGGDELPARTPRIWRRGSRSSPSAFSRRRSSRMASLLMRARYSIRPRAATHRGASRRGRRAVAFGLQLYFDFSAYSDMAVGLSKMLGIRMPINFESPYKATSIIEFWRRWHMTLSRFLRDYVYIPLGGNRRGIVRRYANLVVTMLLGGLWHGAAWTFVLWGAVHGAFLAVNHGWVRTRSRLPAGPSWVNSLGAGVGAVLTFVAVFGAWTIFRADDLPSALSILRGLCRTERPRPSSIRADGDRRDRALP